MPNRTEEFLTYSVRLAIFLSICIPTVSGLPLKLTRSTPTPATINLIVSTGRRHHRLKEWLSRGEDFSSANGPSCERPRRLSILMYSYVILLTGSPPFLLSKNFMPHFNIAVVVWLCKYTENFSTFQIFAIFLIKTNAELSFLTSHDVCVLLSLQIYKKEFKSQIFLLSIKKNLPVTTSFSFRRILGSVSCQYVPNTWISLWMNRLFC